MKAAPGTWRIYQVKVDGSGRFIVMQALPLPDRDPGEEMVMAFIEKEIGHRIRSTATGPGLRPLRPGDLLICPRSSAEAMGDAVRIMEPKGTGP